MPKKPTSNDIADFEGALGFVKQKVLIVIRAQHIELCRFSKHVYNTTFSCRGLLGQLGALKVTEWQYKRWPRVKVRRLHG